MKHVMTALLLTFALTGAAACGDDDGGSENSAKAGNEYPSQVRENFLKSCDAQPNASRSVCECTLDKVEKTVSYDDFKKADQAIRDDAGAKPKGYDQLVKAAETCAKQAADAS